MSSTDASLPFLAGERLNLSSAEVLLIDSQPESLDVLTQMFAGFGVHTPHRATSVEEGQAMVGAHGFSLIIVDSVLSGGDGFGFVKWLRRSASAPNRFASVVLLMGHTRSSEIFKGRDCGANFVVRKPAPPLVMMQRILWLSRDKREFGGAGLLRPGPAVPDARTAGRGPGAAQGRSFGEPRRRQGAQSRSVGYRRPVSAQEGDLNKPARVFKVENTLAKVVRLPGGRTVAEALRSADTRIGRLKGACVAAMHKRIGRLSELADDGKAGKVGVLDEIHAASNEILGLAGAFGMNELGEAAYSLCDLAYAFRDGVPTNWTAVDVHINGLRLLCDEVGDLADRHGVLIGLRKVRDRFVANAVVAKT
jgi:DNA-binding response OmpR family regulator